MARTLLLILSLLLALPAIVRPTCEHGAAMPMATTAMSHHSSPAQPHEATHSCIGCIPPSDWQRAPLAVPAVAARSTPLVTIRRLDPGAPTPPAIPPPRSI